MLEFGHRARTEHLKIHVKGVDQLSQCSAYATRHGSDQDGHSRLQLGLAVSKHAVGGHVAQRKSGDFDGVVGRLEPH